MSARVIASLSTTSSLHGTTCLKCILGLESWVNMVNVFLYKVYLFYFIMSMRWYEWPQCEHHDVYISKIASECCPFPQNFALEWFCVFWSVTYALMPDVNPSTKSTFLQCFSSVFFLSIFLSCAHKRSQVWGCDVILCKNLLCLWFISCRHTACEVQNVF